MDRTEYRVHVFADFWNYTLSAQEKQQKFSTDWKRFPKILTREAGALIDPSALVVYAGMNVYGSYNANTENRLKNWATSVLDTFPGVNAQFKPRTKKKGYPSCPKCHTSVEKCASCSSDMRGTEEKGVDTRLATDLVSLAWEDAYDVAVLVTSDQDFVPAAEILQNKGKKVIHAAFPPHGWHLKQKCWGSIDLGKFMKEFEFKKMK
ncbi:NYN domain-containing protein [Tateyamaria sp. syn59]|uniref:NYN domain-containing protein n=1 Tax=Tateyamaria sp. syn59 TaxID=2576942 RepID=UPI0011BFB0BA|nr:NYN domain-containing protein [Tateyamaria sp. syn59]